MRLAVALMLLPALPFAPMTAPAFAQAAPLAGAQDQALLHFLDRAFDERLGLGSGEPWASGEEIDLLLRALELGARIEYDPELEIEHERRPYTPELAARDGASVGYLLRKHRYDRRMVARMLVRPLGGALLSLLRLDLAQARIHLAMLRGRIRGYRARSSSNSAR